MSIARVDRELATVLARRRPSLKRLEDVVQLMEHIQRSVRRDDGIWWFTELYRRVTIAVDAACRETFFLHPAWMRELVISFADLYFEALQNWLEGSRATCPPAWRVLFAKRLYVRRNGYSPLQFALAGVNAHIQRDLGRAVVRANKAFPHLCIEDVQEDYRRVNRILDEVEVEAMRMMATGWIKRAADVVHPWDRRAAMLVIRLARELAWYTGRWTAVLAVRHPGLSRALSALIEWYAWLCGRLIVMPIGC
jgi:hypothetical protein